MLLQLQRLWDHAIGVCSYHRILIVKNKKNIVPLYIFCCMFIKKNFFVRKYQTHYLRKLYFQGWSRGNDRNIREKNIQQEKIKKKTKKNKITQHEFELLSNLSKLYMIILNNRFKNIIICINNKNKSQGFKQKSDFLDLHLNISQVILCFLIFKTCHCMSLLDAIKQNQNFDFSHIIFSHINTLPVRSEREDEVKAFFYVFLFIIFIMSKMIVLLMDRDYPFTQQQHTPRQYQNILVRQTLSTPRFNKNTTLAKANFLKNLKNKYLVKVEELLEQEQTIHVMYQYVQNKLVNVLKGASILLLNKIYAQLNQFGRYLSNIGVRILFSIDKMGFTTKQTLKYFMGVDFEWEEDPDEQYLQQFYQKQAQQILGPYLKHRIAPQLAVNNSQNSSSKIDENKLRKISYSTLPSRYNRYYKIDQKLKQIKSSSKVNKVEPIVRKLSSVETVSKNNLRLFRNDEQKLSNKRQQRKYSGDIKYEVMSLTKLYQKQSDIKSEYRARKKKLPQNVQQQSMHSQTGTSKTKSRIDEMKQKQYRDIYNLKKDYLKDFISVLEEQQQLNHHQEKQTIFRRTDSLQFNENSTQKLQEMAMNAIKNSLKAIHKFRNIIYDS